MQLKFVIKFAYTNSESSSADCSTCGSGNAICTITCGGEGEDPTVCENVKGIEVD